MRTLSNGRITFRIQAGILVVTFGKIGAPITDKDFIAMARRRLGFQGGVPYPMLVICPGEMRSTLRAVRYLSPPEGGAGVKACAILLDLEQPVTLVRLFVRGKDVPTDLFFRLSDALNWLNQQCGFDDEGLTDHQRLEEMEALLEMEEQPQAPAGADDESGQKAPKILGPLTVRQYEIVLLIAAGKTTKQIAGTLGISPRTVDSHRRHINDKLGLRNVAELMRWLMKNRRNTA